MQAALHSLSGPGGAVEQAAGFYYLRGRQAAVEIRLERQRRARQLWPPALYFARRIGALPFVRMAAITGALALDNEPGNDIDYLIVTEPGRLWTSRALVILWVKIARMRGCVLCPNYLVTRRALRFPIQDFFAAHELAQMVPVTGLAVYSQMRSENQWLARYLPNARGAPPQQARRLAAGRLGGEAKPGPNHWLERLLSSQPAQAFETWEMERKVRRFSRLAAGNPEASFGADWCKGHFSRHAGRTRAGFQQRLQELDLEPPFSAPAQD